MIYKSSYIIDAYNKNRKNSGQLSVGSDGEEESEMSNLISRQLISDDDILSLFSPMRLKLAEHMRLDNIVFLFGNGASMYAGSQDTKEFDLSEYANKPKFKPIVKIVEKIKLYPGIEEQLNALISVSSYFHLIDDSNKKIIDELIAIVKSALISNFVNSIDYRKLYLHEIMLRKLRSFECIGKTSIYTLNYDLAFEYSFDNLGIEYKDGFSGFVNRIFDPKNLESKGVASLIKIHGSVNWVDTNNEIKELQPQFSEGKVVISDERPVLIYPTSNKLYQTYTSPYSELMRHMLDELESDRNVVIVIGYKYGDEHVNEILLKALKNPHNIFYFFSYSSNADNPFLRNIQCLAESMPNVNYLEGKILADFCNFVKYMLPATPEKTDQEKVIELLGKVLNKHGQ